MTVKAQLDALIDEQQDRGHRRIEVYLSPTTLAAFRAEMAPLLTHRTQSWQGAAYRGCPIHVVAGVGDDYLDVVGILPVSMREGA